jgi:hypothetical protein
MALARLGDDSDVYVYEYDNDQFMCQWCQLNWGRNYTTDTEGMRAHLHHHRDVGHRVPQEAFDEIDGEVA